MLLLTTTAAAQDRHTETAPDTGENLQTAPNAEQLRQQIETLQRQLDLLEKGRDTRRKETRAAFRSRGTHRQHERNHPLDTPQTINEAVKIVIYNDNVGNTSATESLSRTVRSTPILGHGHAVPVQGISAVGDACIACDRSGGFAHAIIIPTRAASAPNTASAIAGDIRESIFRLKRRSRLCDFQRPGPHLEYNRGGYGNLIIVRHDNGLETYYGHLSERLVQSGEWVEAGQIIGLGGSTGRSTGPHLHFETRYYGQAFDPERLIDFESGILRRQTFLLKKSFFDIRSNAGQDFDDEAEVEKADKKEAAEKSRNLPHDQVGRYARRLARRYGTTVSKLCSLNGIKSTTILRFDASSGSAKQTDEPEQGGVWYETGSVPDDATPETNYQIANKNSTKPSNT